MTDRAIIKALEYCSTKGNCYKCYYQAWYTTKKCREHLAKEALDLIQRQQAKIDELTDQEARFAFDRIHYNIAELNLIKTGFDIAEIKRRFRAEFEEKMELGIDDCINWADWLDSIVSELLEEAKEGARNDR